MSSKRQINICKMIQGDKQTIRESLNSSNDLVRIDGILWTAYHRYTDADIINRLKELKADEAASFGYTVGNFAVSALDVLGAEKYTGGDKSQKDLIEGFIPSEKEAAEILKRNSV